MKFTPKIIKSDILEILLLLILIKSFKSVSYCLKGCQKCKKISLNLYNCEICDNSRYKLLDGKCVKLFDKNNNKDLENCIMSNIQGKCMICSKYYFVKNGKCLKIKKEIKDNNCIFYGEDCCLKCRENFFLNGKKCCKFGNEKDKDCLDKEGKVYNKIENCSISAKIDKNGIICKKCKNTRIIKSNKIFFYLPSLDSKKCLLAEHIHYCLYYSYIGCSSCKDNFQMNNTRSIKKIVDNKKLLSEITMDSISLNTNTKLFPVCFKINPDLKHCIVFQDHENCKICEDGYFLKNKTYYDGKVFKICQVYLYNSGIDNCRIEDKFGNCKLCKDGFLLKCENYLEKNNNSKICKSCIFIEKLLGCKIYDWKKNIQICIKCHSSYFLNSEKTCTLVDNRIFGCLEYKNYQNNFYCESCYKDYTLNSLKTKCLLKLPNCEIHNCKEESCVCEKCDKFFFLKNFYCLKGNINKCEIYLDENNCKKCSRKYFINSEKICENGRIKNCLEYYFDNNISNCEKCEKSYLPTKNLNSCRYFLIPKSNNEMCSENNIDINELNPQWIDNLLFYCAKFNSLNYDTKYLSCESCKKGFSPVLLKDLFFCTHLNYLNYFIQNYKIINNCEFYKIIGNLLVCEKCSEDYFSDLDSNSCLKNCSNNKKKNDLIFFKNDKLIIKRQCFEETFISNCEEYLIAYHNEIKAILCKKCKEGYQINTTTEESNFYKILNHEKNLFINDYLKISKNECQSQIKIENCHLIDTTGNHKCEQCKIGYKLNEELICEINPEELYTLVGEDKRLGRAIKFQKYMVPLCEENRKPQIDLINGPRCVIPTFKIRCHIYLKNDLLHKCIACKPGFTPIYNNKGYVKRCIKIDNCDTSDIDNLIFNTCNKCKKNYVFRFQDNIFYEECIKNSVENCFAGTNEECLFCKEGYRLINNICEKLQFYNCEDNFTKIGNLNYYKFNGEKILVAITKEKSYFSGCNKCKNNSDIKLLINLNKENPLICADTNYNNIISHCKNHYSVNENEKDTILCKQCKGNFYVLNFEKNKCLLRENLENCSRMRNEFCITCKNNYALENNKCILPYINNCTEIKNGKCIKCKEKYILINLKNDIKKCFKLKKNCIKGMIKKEDNTLKITCLDCEPLNYPCEINDIKRCDLTLDFDNYCKIYDNTGNSETSSMECLKSTEINNYYIKNNRNIRRSFYDPFCLTYDRCANFCAGSCNCLICEEKDFINGCKENFILIDNVCTELPLSGCKIFKKYNVCKTCKRNFYLLNDKCLRLKKEQKVTYCLIYSFDEYSQSPKCIKCKRRHKVFFYKLNPNTFLCEQTLAKNCKTYSLNNKNKCETCDPGYYLAEEKFIEKKNKQKNTLIISCIKRISKFCQNYFGKEKNYNDSKSAHCKNCQNNIDMLIDNSEIVGKCTFLEKHQKIQNCKIHEKKADKILICNLCNESFAYDKKNNSCQPINTPKENFLECKNFETTNENSVKCSLCNFGFYYKDDHCHECKKGCYFCYFPKEKEECVYCKNGYFMNENMKCIKNEY